MSSLSIVQWVVVLGVAFLVCFPIARVLRRIGFSGWWALLWIVPFANIVALWIFAYRPWPRDAAGN
jgi:hypothetical protein